jgi:hypothetical protein
VHQLVNKNFDNIKMQSTTVKITDIMMFILVQIYLIWCNTLQRNFSCIGGKYSTNSFRSLKEQFPVFCYAIRARLGLHYSFVVDMRQLHYLENPAAAAAVD